MTKSNNSFYIVGFICRSHLRVVVKCKFQNISICSVRAVDHTKSWNWWQSNERDKTIGLPECDDFHKFSQMTVNETHQYIRVVSLDFNIWHGTKHNILGLEIKTWNCNNRCYSHNTILEKDCIDCDGLCGGGGRYC